MASSNSKGRKAVRGSRPDIKAHSRKAARRTPPAPQPQPKSRYRRPTNRLPDLSDILLAVRDAQALVTVAHAVLVRGNAYGPEENVLRMGVEALRVVYRRLEESDLQLARFHKKNVSALRGAL